MKALFFEVTSKKARSSNSRDNMLTRVFFSTIRTVTDSQFVRKKLKPHLVVVEFPLFVCDWALFVGRLCHSIVASFFF